MKINQLNTLQINNKVAIFKLIKGMTKGSSIPARIISRSSLNEAVLEIKGKHIKAEFLKGVPGNNTLTLKLENIKKDQYIFSITDQTSRKNYSSSISPYTLLNSSQVDTFNSFNLNNFITMGFNDLFELNFFLLKGFNPKKDKNDNLLSRLIAAGISKELIETFSFISISSRFNFSLFSFIWSILKKDRNPLGQMNNQRILDEKLDELIFEIDNKLDESKKEIIIRQIIDFLSDNIETEKDTYAGEFFLPDQNNFKKVKYLLNGDNLFLSMELSVIGKIDILFKNLSDRCMISFFYDQKVPGFEMESYRKRLFESLAQNKLNFEIYFYNRKIIIDKIKEINSYYSLNSGFDLKV